MAECASALLRGRTDQQPALAITDQLEGIQLIMGGLFAQMGGNGSGGGMETSQFSLGALIGHS